MTLSGFVTYWECFALNDESGKRHVRITDSYMYLCGSLRVLVRSHMHAKPASKAGFTNLTYAFLQRSFQRPALFMHAYFTSLMYSKINESSAQDLGRLNFKLTQPDGAFHNHSTGKRGGTNQR